MAYSNEEGHNATQAQRWESVLAMLLNIESTPLHHESLWVAETVMFAEQAPGLMLTTLQKS